MNRFKAISLPAAALAISLAASADDALLDGALNEDKSLNEVVSRFKGVQSKQEESGVFSSGDIAQTKEAIDGVGKVKTENVSAIINALDKASAAKEASAKDSSLGGAKEQYEIAIRLLEELAKKKAAKLEAGMERQELLEKQKALMEDLKELDKELKKDAKVDEKAINKLAQIAAQQDELKEAAKDEPVKEKMKEASKKIQEIDVKTALKRQEEAIKELQKQVDAEKSPELKEIAKTEEESQADNDLKQLQEQLQDSAEGKKPLSDQERQDMAQKMDQVSKQLSKRQEKEQAQKTADQMRQAIENAMTRQDKAAQRNIQNVMDMLKQSRALAKKKEEKPLPPPMANDSKESKPKEGDGVKGGASGSSKSGSDWTAKLPEKERDALLAARKAKFNDSLDEEVRLYFTKLAQESP